MPWHLAGRRDEAISTQFGEREPGRMPGARLSHTEDQLVEQPAIGLFAELGWTMVSALEETFGATSTLRRETIPFFRFGHQSGIDAMRTLWSTIAP